MSTMSNKQGPKPENPPAVSYDRQTGHYEVRWNVMTDHLRKASRYYRLVSPNKLALSVMETAGLGAIQGMRPDVTLDKGMLGQTTIRALNDLYKEMRREGSAAVPEPLPTELLVDVTLALQAEALAGGFSNLGEEFMENAAKCGVFWFLVGVGIAAAAILACSSCGKSCSGDHDDGGDEDSKKGNCFPPIPLPEDAYMVLRANSILGVSAAPVWDSAVQLELFVAANTLDYVGVSIAGTRLILIRNGIH